MRSIAIMTQLQMEFKLRLINHTLFVYQVILKRMHGPFKRSRISWPLSTVSPKYLVAPSRLTMMVSSVNFQIFCKIAQMLS